MASADQFNQMMEMMRLQMEQIKALSEENTELRQGGAQSVVKRPDRPVVEANCSDNEWDIFLDSWRRYKTMARLTRPDEVASELLTCCSADVNKSLYEFIGSAELDRSTEEQLLTHIKSVAVKGVHKEVHRLRFTNL